MSEISNYYNSYKKYKKLYKNLNMSHRSTYDIQVGGETQFIVINNDNQLSGIPEVNNILRKTLKGLVEKTEYSVEGVIGRLKGDTIEELEKITANSNLDKQKKYLDTEECLDFIQTLLISDVEVGITKLKTKLNTK